MSQSRSEVSEHQQGQLTEHSDVNQLESSGSSDEVMVEDDNILASRQRRISLSDGAPTKADVIKEGYLDLQKTFQRWSKKYCVIDGDKLFISRTPDDKLREEVSLQNTSVAESGAKNLKHCFMILVAENSLVFSASSRKHMEDWIGAFKLAAHFSKKDNGIIETLKELEGQHSLFAGSHSNPRQMVCTVCGEAGMSGSSLACEICKLRCHRKCVGGASRKCKWTTRDQIERDGGVLGSELTMPHQWVEGNLPSGAKCICCDRACSHTRRAQDLRCLWCKKTVHKDCIDKIAPQCCLGNLRSCILPPSAIRRSDAVRKGMWEPCCVSGFSPILALVNSKSGNNQGVRFLRKLKYWLNPVQVFDLAISGPDLGLELFKGFESFKVLVFGGDGSIGWVLSAIDRLQLHSKCMVGVVPLGTGNDMARVLGWGAQCGDEDRLPQVLSEMEMSTFRLLDRWSVQYSRSVDVDVSSLEVQNTRSSHRHFSLSLSGAHDHTTATPTITTATITTAVNTADAVHVVPGAHDFASPTSPWNGDPFSLTSPDSGIEDLVTRVCVHPSDTVDIVQSEGRAVPMTTEQKQLCPSVDNMQESILHLLSTISSAWLLCRVVKQIMALLIRTQKTHAMTSSVIAECGHTPMSQTCTVLSEKLKALEAVLGEGPELLPLDTPPLLAGEGFQSREALMARANSVKKAVKGVLDVAASSVQDEVLIKAEIEGLARAMKSQGLLSINVSEASNNSGNKTKGRLDSPEKGDEKGNESPPENVARAGQHEAGRQVLCEVKRALGHHGSVVELSPPLADMREIASINNYLGVGLDAKIAYEFNNTRDKSPAVYSSRTKNMMLYGLLGGKEFLFNTQRYLERRLSLMCDGKPIVLPQKLQGLVFLNIPSYMAGTNFWGTDKEKDGFLAPSHDDKLIEVIGITGFTQLATSKVLGIQNHRLAQCHYAQLTLQGPDTLPVQVDGEAWLQDPGTIVISHKNKARMLVKDKVFSQSLETWKGRVNESPPTSHEAHYQQLCTALKPLFDWIKVGMVEDLDVHRELTQHATVISQLILDCAHHEVTVGFSNTCHSVVPSVQALLQRLHGFQEEGKIPLEREGQLAQLLKQIEMSLVPFCGQEPKDPSRLEHKDYGRRASDSVLKSPRAVSMLKSPRAAACGHKVPGMRARLNQLSTEALRPHRMGTEGLRPVHVTTEGLKPSPVASPGIGLLPEASRHGVEFWTVADVCMWMEHIGLGEHARNMQSHRISGKELVKLQQDDLEEVLGITRHDQKLCLEHGLCAIGLIQLHNADQCQDDKESYLCSIRNGPSRTS